MINIYKIRYKYYRSGIIYVQNWRVCELLKCIRAIQKQLTNRSQVIINQTPHMNIWNTWKTLKYLNIDDCFHLKSLEIYKYKWESKAWMPIKFCCLFFVNCGLFSFLNNKMVKIQNENTVADGNVLCKRIHSNLHQLVDSLRVSLNIFKNLQLECILHYLNILTEK